MLQVEVGVFALNFWGGVGCGLVQALRGCGAQAVTAAFAFLLRGFELVAQHHEFIDFGDDAVLLGKGGSAKGSFSKVPFVTC